MDTAEFLREKAAQCRAIAANLDDQDATARGLNAMALELDAEALAIEAGKATERELETAMNTSGEGSGSSVQRRVQ